MGSNRFWNMLSGETKPTVATRPGLQVGDRVNETDTGNTYEYKGAGAGWAQISTSGAALVSGLAPTMRRLPAGTYNATNILGVRILVVGTGTLTLVPASGDTAVVITAAEITAMGTNLELTVPTLSSVTAGTGMDVLLLTR